MKEKIIPKIIYEDKNILVVDKPSRFVVHPFDNSTEFTLLDFLQENYKNIFKIKNEKKLQDGRTINLGGIVHRLDRDTSGVLVVAKTKEAFDNLKNQFKNQRIKKEYSALVEGEIKKDSFVINAPLGRNKKDYKQFVNPKNPRGKLREAITEVKVSKRKNGKTLVKLIPKTGRTHQLRAHMSYIGHPIIGDKAYGSKINSLRIMLHAEKIYFLLKKKEYSFSVKLPKDFLV